MTYTIASVWEFLWKDIINYNTQCLMHWICIILIWDWRKEFEIKRYAYKHAKRLLCHYICFSKRLLCHYSVKERIWYQKICLGSARGPTSYMRVIDWLIVLKKETGVSMLLLGLEFGLLWGGKYSALYIILWWFWLSVLFSLLKFC